VEAEAKALKTYLENGPTLTLDAVFGLFDAAVPDARAPKAQNRASKTPEVEANLLAKTYTASKRRRDT